MAYAVFGTSRALAVGPVAVISLMTLTAASNIAPPGSPNVALEQAQLDALVLGLPWQRVGSRGAITVI